MGSARGVLDRLDWLAAWASDRVRRVLRVELGVRSYVACGETVECGLGSAVAREYSSCLVGVFVFLAPQTRVSYIRGILRIRLAPV